MTCGVWDSTPYQRVVSRSSGNELLYLLEGSVTLTDAAGREEHFQAGDAVYVPKGTEVEEYEIRADTIFDLRSIGWLRNTLGSLPHTAGS